MYSEITTYPIYIVFQIILTGLRDLVKKYSYFYRSKFSYNVCNIMYYYRHATDRDEMH